MKRNWWRVCASALASLLLLFLAAPAARADVNDFVIKRFDADYSLSRQDPQGELQIKETLQVDFSGQNHGILRAIPNRYKKHSLQLHIGDIKADGQAVPWSTYQSNGNTVLKIGDPNQTVTGQHIYEIQYQVRNVITFYDGHDELYWDINGDQWPQAAQEVSVALRLPEGLKLSQQKPVCYTGPFGSTEQACHITVSGDTVSAQATRQLTGYETMSIVAGFEKGYFRPATIFDTLGEYVATAIKFMIPLLLIGGTAAVHWRRYGRDPKGRRVIVPEYEAPNGLKPIEVGTIADFRTDNRDITAAVIDLAIRGYIKIIETTQARKFRADVKSYAFRLENPSLDGLDQFEKTLLKGIFARYEKGEEVDLGTLKYKLAATASTLKSAVNLSLTERGYFRKTSFSTTLRFIGLIFAEYLAVIVLAIFAGTAVVVGIFAATAVFIIFLILLPSRTLQGVAAKESIMGLKLYLEIAEAERIKKLQSPDAPYAPQSAEPKKTVELFEKLLPYAVVLGVEEKWAKKFEDIYRAQPGWYEGNSHAFSAAYLASSIGGGVSSGVNAAFSSPSSSGSSGFSGGGAGGGGGGGGGGW